MQDTTWPPSKCLSILLGKGHGLGLTTAESERPSNQKQEIGNTAQTRDSGYFILVMRPSFCCVVTSNPSLIASAAIINHLPDVYTLQDGRCNGRKGSLGSQTCRRNSGRAQGGRGCAKMAGHGSRPALHGGHRSSTATASMSLTAMSGDAISKLNSANKRTWQRNFQFITILGFGCTLISTWEINIT